MAAELNIVGDPLIYLNHKIIEVIDAYKARPNYLCPLKVDRLD